MEHSPSFPLGRGAIDGLLDWQMSDCDPDDIPSNMDTENSMQIQHSNWQVVNCTTPANYYHVLRRQVGNPTACLPLGGTCECPASNVLDVVHPVAPVGEPSPPRPPYPIIPFGLVMMSFHEQVSRVEMVELGIDLTLYEPN